MLNIIFWIIFGFLVGWIAAILISDQEKRPAPLMAISITGSFIGGASVQIIMTGHLIGIYNPLSIVGAVIIAVSSVILCLHLISDGHASH